MTPDHLAAGDGRVACVHDWQPIMGWVGRYRCTRCGGIGHRCTGDSEAKAPFGRPFELIVPYRCARKGCDRAAVRRRPKQLCTVHDKESK